MRLIVHCFSKSACRQTTRQEIRVGAKVEEADERNMIGVAVLSPLWKDLLDW